MSQMLTAGAGAGVQLLGAATDPNFASVVLLALNENGADTSTTFTDASSAARTLTTNGNAQWDTAQAPAGLTSSGLFDGAGDSISAADSADWLVGTDYTWEAWVRPAASLQYAGVVTQWALDATANFGLGFGTDETNKAGFLWRPFSAGAPIVENTATFSTNTWYAAAVTKEGSTFRLYIDGTKVAEATSATSGVDSTSVLSIGNWINGGVAFNGHIASVRLTKDVARYTGNSYTVPALPLPTS